MIDFVGLPPPPPVVHSAHSCAWSAMTQRSADRGRPPAYGCINRQTPLRHVSGTVSLMIVNVILSTISCSKSFHSCSHYILAVF